METFPEIEVRQDTEVAISVIKHAAEWMVEAGLDGEEWWDPSNVNRNFLSQYAKEDEFYVAYAGDKPAAAAIIQSEQIAQDWSSVDSDSSPRALYIHWLAVEREFAKQGFPKVLVDHAEELARQQHIPVLRVDTDANQQDLCELYESLGFKRVDIVSDGTHNTALYEKPVRNPELSIMFRGVKAIFFDTADTLYTNPDLEAEYPQKVVELLASTRKISEAEAKVLLKQTTEKLQATEKHVTKVRAMAELGYTRAQVHEAFLTVIPGDFLKPDKDLEPIMKQLAERYKLGIISNFRRVHVIEILDALGLSENWFPLLITEDIVKEIKPNPEPFLTAIKKSGHKADECLYVGDSPTKDMQPAKEVGMRTILVGDKDPSEQAEFIDAAIPNVKKIVEIL